MLCGYGNNRIWHPGMDRGSGHGHYHNNACVEVTFRAGFIREDLHISLVAAGALVGVVQLAGAFGGLAASSGFERIGAKYTWW